MSSIRRKPATLRRSDLLAFADTLDRFPDLITLTLSSAANWEKRRRMTRPKARLRRRRRTETKARSHVVGGICREVRGAQCVLGRRPAPGSDGGEAT